MRGALGFVLITCAWSWLLWLPMLPAYRAAGLEAPPWVLALLLLGAYGPTLTAIALSRRQPGGVRALLRKLAIWRVGLRWYAVAIFLPALVSLGGALIFAARGGEIGELDFSRLHIVPIVLLVGAFFGPLAEELGWRGYLLPRLLERFHPLTASLIVGFVWTFWHTPLFWAPAGTSISGEPVTISSVAFYLAFLTGYSIFYTWLHLKSGGSVLLAFLLHLTFNASLLNRILPGLWEVNDSVERWSLIPLWVLAGLAVWRGFEPENNRREGTSPSPTARVV